MHKPKYSKEMVDEVIKAKQLLRELTDIVQDLVDEMVHGNATDQLDNQTQQYDHANPAPFGSPIGVTARIRYKDSGDETDKYFSFEVLDEETMMTPSGIPAKDIFLCCSPKEFMGGFPTEFFELV